MVQTSPGSAESFWVMHVIHWQPAGWPALSWPQRGLGTYGGFVLGLLAANEQLALKIYLQFLYYYYLPLSPLNLVCNLWNNGPFHSCSELTNQIPWSTKKSWVSSFQLQPSSLAAPLLCLGLDWAPSVGLRRDGRLPHSLSLWCYTAFIYWTEQRKQHTLEPN